jgi:hypothetical protein
VATAHLGHGPPIAWWGNGGPQRGATYRLGNERHDIASFDDLLFEPIGMPTPTVFGVGWDRAAIFVDLR